MKQLLKCADLTLRRILYQTQMQMIQGLLHIVGRRIQVIVHLIDVFPVYILVKLSDVPYLIHVVTDLIQAVGTLIGGVIHRSCQSLADIRKTV